MFGKYDEDPITELYCTLLSTIHCYMDGDKDRACKSFKESPDIIQNILNSNEDCEVFDESLYSYTEVVPDTLYVYGIVNAKANDQNMFMDCINNHGTTTVVIFLDYFKDIITERAQKDDTDIQNIASNFMGNSIYFDALVDISRVAIEIIKPTNMNNQNLSMCKTFRDAPALIAARIINFILPITEDDVYDPNVKFDELKKYAKCEYNVFKLRLMGIKM